jgi:hypothetical protein
VPRAHSSSPPQLSPGGLAPKAVQPRPLSPGAHFWFEAHRHDKKTSQTGSLPLHAVLASTRPSGTAASIGPAAALELQAAKMAVKTAMGTRGMAWARLL